MNGSCIENRKGETDGIRFQYAIFKIFTLKVVETRPCCLENQTFTRPSVFQ